MKQRLIHGLAVSLAASVVLLAACSTDAPTGVQSQSDGVVTFSRDGYNQAGAHRQYGTPVKVGNGTARAYVVADARHGQAPLELGVALSSGALDALPTDGMHMYLLPLPQLAPAPYQLVELDWNPTGHPPEGVYTFPHFDFHFYFISLAERNAIVPSDPNYATEADNLPTGAFVPSLYAPLAGPGQTPADVAVPMMGLHWEDLTSPELQNLLGNPSAYRQFTRTFIYGSWNGQFIFVEPMVTRAFLASKPDVSAPVRVPQRYPTAGYFPTSYRVTYDAQAGETRVALTGMVERN